MNPEQMKLVIEAALLAAGEPLNLERLRYLFDENDKPSLEDLRQTLRNISESCADRSYELKEVASGYCFQVKTELNEWIRRLNQERPAKYSRAFLETLAIIAYRQPITRAEIEDIRGVVVSSNIMKNLLEHEWVRVVGQREVPGRPSLYATTRQFLDHFNLKSLEELPVLEDLKDLDAVLLEKGSDPSVIMVGSDPTGDHVEEKNSPLSLEGEGQGEGDDFE